MNEFTCTVIKIQPGTVECNQMYDPCIAGVAIVRMYGVWSTVGDLSGPLF